MKYLFYCLWNKSYPVFCWYNQLVCFAYNIYFTGASTAPEVRQSCTQSSYVKSSMQNQENWRWVWWQGDTISICRCCGFSSFLSLKSACKTHLRSRCRHDDNWKASQFSWKVQGIQFMFISRIIYYDSIRQCDWCASSAFYFSSVKVAYELFREFGVGIY